MSGEEADERKANALKQSLDYLDLFLAASPYVATSHLTIADFSILASVTQLEGMEYKITAYPWVRTIYLARKVRMSLSFHVALLLVAYIHTMKGSIASVINLERGAHSVDSTQALLCI